MQYVGKLTFYFKPRNSGAVSQAYDPSDCIEHDGRCRFGETWSLYWFGADRA